MYEGEVAKDVAKWAPILQVQIMAQIFEPMDPILLVEFLQAFNMACDDRDIHDGAPMMSLFTDFMRKSPAAALTALFSLLS